MQEFCKIKPSYKSFFLLVLKLTHIYSLFSKQGSTCNYVLNLASIAEIFFMVCPVTVILWLRNGLMANIDMKYRC
jgi:hypothetical protein